MPSYKNKEIVFELKQKSKNYEQKINDLSQIIIKQNKEIFDLGKEITLLKNEIE